MIFGDLGDAKSVFFIGRGDKICNLAKNEFGQFWDRFGRHFGCFWDAWGSLKQGKVGSRRGSKKSSIFETPFFLILADFGCPGGSKKLRTLDPFSAPFRSWRLFFCSGAILDNFHGFKRFRNHF